MGKSARKASKHKVRSGEDAEHKLYCKALKYIARGSNKKLDKLLDRNPETVLSRGYAGNTPLHDACRAGNANAVTALVAKGAILSTKDDTGNTPLHVAALHGHVELINTVLKLGYPVDVDITNNNGQTVFELVEAAIERLQAASAAADAGAASAPGQGPHQDYHSPKSPDTGPDDFASRLRYEMMAEDPEAAELRFGEEWGGAGAASGGDLDDDDAWADRIWRDMQARRRQQQQAASRSFLGDMRKEQQEREAKSRAESARILQEEMAKDAAWRQAAIKQAPSIAALRAAYDAKWQALQEQLPAGGIRHSDVPWLVDDLSDKERFEAVVLHGVVGPGDVKRRLRSELLRWHPDKFGARFGAVLAAGDRGRVLAAVQQTSQMLTSMVSR